MKQFFFILALLVVAGARAETGFPPKRPNIVILLADDMGFSDAGCYGGEIQTPNLDALARGGLRFTQFYNTARCWPSRAAILTGYYAQEVRRDTLPGVVSNGLGGQRPAWARLLPEYLHERGYRSYHSGKWHMDGPVLAGGFDHSYSFDDHNRYFSPELHGMDDKPLPPVRPGSGYYATTAIAEHAIEMLAEHQVQHRDQPFFLYLAFNAPHFPLQALPEDMVAAVEAAENRHADFGRRAGGVVAGRSVGENVWFFPEEQRCRIHVRFAFAACAANPVTSKGVTRSHPHRNFDGKFADKRWPPLR